MEERGIEKQRDETKTNRNIDSLSMGFMLTETGTDGNP
jgi:hypothetical protein